MNAGTSRFDEYMERCLYDEADGFYARHGNAGGRRGDFVTSPEVGPLFGAVLARALDGWWRELGEPSAFTVVEAGAGRGALAASILAAEPECGVALRYVTVERSERLRAEQRRLLGDRVEVAATLDEVDDGAPVVGVILANELLDNLPFRLFVADAGGWGEVVVVDGAAVVAPARDAPPLPDAPPGTRLPWCERAAAWVADAIGRVAAGRVVVVDYGVRTTDELIGREWLRTYRDHQRGGDPFEAPGRCDITADVPFDQLPSGAAIATQAEFLRRWGIDELVEEGRATWSERAHVADLAALRARSRVAEADALTDPGGLGGFLVAQWTAGGAAAATRASA